MDSTPFYWVLVDTQTEKRPHPALKFTDRVEAEAYHKLAYDGDSRYALRMVEGASRIDPEEPTVR